MSLLGQQALIDRIGRGELVLAGSPEQAQKNVGHASYSCKPGKIIRCDAQGDRREILDWTDTGGDDVSTCDVAPGEMVWVRTKHEVKVPATLCGFWWQTNSLSRRGLMLVNASMVEPGYRGHLACLFVNFGKQSISLNVDTVVAKLAFMEITGPGPGFEPERAARHYDNLIIEAARSAPSKFLALAELHDESLRQARTEIDEAARTALAEVRKEVHDEARAIKGELADEADKLKESVSTDLVGAVKKALPWAAILFFLVLVALMVIGYVRNELAADLDKRLERQIETRLEQLGTTTTGGASTTTAPASTGSTTSSTTTTTGP